MLGGGITWKKDTPNLKNAVSNGPAIVLATRLYNVTQEEKYLTWAKGLYEWQKSNLVDPQTGLVWDHIELIDGEPTVRKDWIFTYNAGAWIGAGVRLYQITREAGYLKDALQTANAAMTRSELSSEGILKNEGQSDGGLFKGIFVRYFVELIMEPAVSDGDRGELVRFLRLNAESFYRNSLRRTDMICGPSWRKLPGDQTDLSTQLSGMMLMEAAALLQEEGVF